MGKRWIPLESNPVVLNKYAKELGFDTSKYAFCDILGLDEVRNLQSCNGVAHLCYTSTACSGRRSCQGFAQD